MKTKAFTEKELLDGLDAHSAHADELATPLPQELTPLERLKGSVKRYERPTAPASDPEDWDAWFEGEGVTEDFMCDREQPSKGRR